MKLDVDECADVDGDVDAGFEQYFDDGVAWVVRNDWFCHIDVADGGSLVPVQMGIRAWEVERDCDEGVDRVQIAGADGVTIVLVPGRVAGVRHGHYRGEKCGPQRVAGDAWDLDGSSFRN